MSGVRILAIGKLHGMPEQRTSKNGNAFTTAKMVADATGDTPALWINITAFGETAEALASLTAGASLSVSGKATITTYAAKDGTHKVSVNVLLDNFLTLSAKPRASSGQSGSRAFSGAGKSAPPGGREPFHDDPLDDIGPGGTP
jgi:single-stranded DNA-binding protein